MSTADRDRADTECFMFEAIASCPAGVGNECAKNSLSGSPGVPRDFDGWVDALSQLTLKANASNSLAAQLDQIATITRQLTGFDFCATLVFDPAAERQSTEGLCCLVHDRADTSTVVPLRTGRRCREPWLHTAVPLWVEDLRNEAQCRPWLDAVRNQGYQTMLTVPLRVGLQVVGALNCYSRTARESEPQTIRIVQALADWARAVIQMSRLRASDAQRLDELDRLNQELTSQNHEIAKCARIQRELADVALASGKAPDIAATLDKVLDGCGVHIHDVRGDLLARAAPITSELFDSPTDEQLAMPVTIDGELVAQITIGVADATATTLQREVLGHAATLCALLLRQERIAGFAEARFLGDLVADLLSADESRVQDATERARRAGYSGTVARRIVVVRPLPDSPLSRPIAAKELAQQLISRNEDVLVGRYGGDLVLLWPAPNSAPDSVLAESLRRLVRRGEAVAVIGQQCTAASEYAQAYRIARGAVALCGSTVGSPVVVSLADLGIYELLLQLQDVSVISRFAEATLGPLREHDESRGSDLVSTLRLYFDNGCHTEITAQAMFLHSNTVNSRLRRIEKLLNISLAHPAHLLRLSAALMADDIVRASSDDQLPTRPEGRP